ncbi:MAG: WbqC family protein [Candidatus Omnitrophica bacterium]|nr:WbqC family protein [Candidatus Omnitrophota bacterium]MBU4479644.1 WbqC family protein [Candidatus Omnitrophota bacterium]MCG2703527.1 WbqC family protein [Candidatus Omnitrophota bacterium]
MDKIMIVSVHQPQYLPWLGYFAKILESDCFVFLDTVQYKTREFQNRNKIRTGKGWIWLTVPVKTKGCAGQSIGDVLIDNDCDWHQEHKKSLQVWYARSRFFKEYFPFFQDAYERKWERLIDLNIHIINYILRELDITTPVYRESDIGTSKKSTERIIELCRKLKADTYLSGIGGRDYLDEDAFKDAGIVLKYQQFRHPEYLQLHTDEARAFEAYMSIVDLLFNEGPGSREILRQGGQ